MQAGTLREGGRLPALAMDDGSGHGGVSVWGTHATARDGSGSTLVQQWFNWGSHQSLQSGNCGGSQPHTSKGVSSEWRHTVGEPIHGLDAASLWRDKSGHGHRKIEQSCALVTCGHVLCCVRTSTSVGQPPHLRSLSLSQLSVFNGLTSPGGLSLPASAYPPSMP